MNKTKQELENHLELSINHLKRSREVLERHKLMPNNDVSIKIRTEAVQAYERIIDRLKQELDMYNNNEPYVYVDNSPAPMHMEPEAIVPGIIFINSDGYRGSDLESSHDCSCGACKE